MVDDELQKTQNDVTAGIGAELERAGYEVADPIGRGGFGIVYRCVQARLDRTVAVKVLTTNLDEDRRRFMREQRAMGRLTGHPNIVNVLQVGETESGYPYLVMPYYRQGSLEVRLRQSGPLALNEVLRLGVKLSGALEVAHRSGILHRDIKPGNILFTDYGQPVLCDFGIAHIPGAFETTSGAFTGSPAYTAPEVILGKVATTACDVYGLAATLFAALTGHAAYERRSGEKIVTQFLRITRESSPDLRENGIPDDIADLIAQSMARDPEDRPALTELGEQLQQIQSQHGFTVDTMAIGPDADFLTDQPPEQLSSPVSHSSTRCNIPLELTPLIGRDSEVAELKKLISTYRLVTITGVGGVGKTRLALHTATEMVEVFPDGVSVIDFSSLTEGSKVPNAVAMRFGLRDRAGTSTTEAVIDYLAQRQVLLILDNCEHIISDVAAFTSIVLRSCLEIRILATSREAMCISGERVLPLLPLGSDSVELFADRAAAIVPSFKIDEHLSAVTQICARLEGLPLAIELAAAKLHIMSPKQILTRLDDSYSLLSGGIRGAPTRQETLTFSIDWSYKLCSPTEQRVWRWLSVFSGGFELDAVEDIGGDEYHGDLINILISLVDKSILIRSDLDEAVRFRFLNPLRDYGLRKLQETDEYLKVRSRHLDWCQRLARDSEVLWVSPRQAEWINRLGRELPNLRDAIEFALSESPGLAAQIVCDLYFYCSTHALLSESRAWLDRALAAMSPDVSVERITAICYATILASDQRDSSAAIAFAREARALLEQLPDCTARPLVDIADGYAALLNGELDRSRQLLKAGIDECHDLAMRADAMVDLAWADAACGDVEAALSCHQSLCALAENHGELSYRSFGLWGLGIEMWRKGEVGDAVEALKQALRLTYQLRDRELAASCLEVLAWIAADAEKWTPAAVMLTAAETVAPFAENWTLSYPNLSVSHQEWDQRIRDAIDPPTYEAAQSKGRGLSFGDATTYGLDFSLN